jgi:hypothetical protein
MTDISPVRMVDDPGTASAIREHLRCAIDHPPTGGAAPDVGLAALERSIAKGGGTPWLTVIAGGLAVVGGAALVIWLGASASEPPRIATRGVVPIMPSVASPEIEAAPPVVTAPPLDPSSSTPAAALAVESPRRKSPARAKEEVVEPDTQREFRLLAAARKAAASAPERAWALVLESEREFPDGMMLEEREAVAIEVLVALGRSDDARRRGERFLARHPKSPSTQRVRELVVRASAEP